MNVSGSWESDEGMLCWQDIIYTEVCDPKTFRRVPYGQRGTPVYTHLERTSQPMIRLLSGDLTLWTNDPTPCGRTYPRLPQGIFGRIDDMITIRGENVYPSEIDAVLNQLADYGGEHRIIITRERTMDELLVRVEATGALIDRGSDAVKAMREDCIQRLQKLLGLRAVVEIVPPDTFQHTDFKARRVIDDRDVFRQMSETVAKSR
jgi:phenylacetate-CoA ligase